VSKTIQKLVIDEHVIVDDIKEILKKTKQFYDLSLFLRVA
jgi:hypothetical protein